MSETNPATRPAGFWRRYAAYSLDFALLATVATTLAWPRLVAAWDETRIAWRGVSDLLGRSLADGMMQGLPPDRIAHAILADPSVVAGAAGVQDGIAHLLLPWLLGYALLAAMYHIGFERSPWQASPGKRALGLAVLDARADRMPSAWRTLLRHVACALSWLTFNLGHALAALPPQKRALHDYIAGTRVTDASGAARLPAWARLWLAAQAVACVVVTAWGLQRYVAALQSAAPG
jgi:uncharacterized RDD family membrane protein YckC